MKSFIKLLSAFGALVGLLCACSVAEVADPVRVRVSVDRPLLPAGGVERLVLKVSLDGIRGERPREEAQRPPVNLALVLDRSGSMSGEKLDKAREAAIEVIRRLSPQDVFSLVVYDSEVRVLIPARHVRNKAEMEDVVETIRAGGNTALYDGVLRGAEELRRHLGDRRFVHRVILLSDGQANVGPSSVAALSRLGSSLMGEGISVSTVGLGLGFNEDLMTRLAQCSDGNTYFVESGADLPRIFNGELGDVLDVVARRVVVEIDFPEGVRPLGFVGREGTIRGRRAEFTLNQLYGGQEKFALVEVELEPGREGQERPMAEACVRFEEAQGGRSMSLRCAGKVRYSADRAAVERAVDRKVQGEYAANVIATAKDEAVALSDAGRKEEAAANMRAKASYVLSMPPCAANAEVQAKAREVLSEASEVETKGIAGEKRKAYRADSAQTKNQQRVK